mgnify:CR=1 FL=1
MKNRTHERTRLVSCKFEIVQWKIPIKYLGLKITIHPLCKVQWHMMLDVLRDVVLAWQRGPRGAYDI